MALKKMLGVGCWGSLMNLVFQGLYCTLTKNKLLKELVLVWIEQKLADTCLSLRECNCLQTVQLLESSQDNSGQEAVEGYLSLARFADTQYQNIVNYMNSPTFEAKQALMNKAAAEYEKYNVSGGQPPKELSQTIVDSDSEYFIISQAEKWQTV